MKVMIRARNRFDAYKYINEGYEKVYRETFYTAIQVGVETLEELGMSHEDAVRQGEIFKVADRVSMMKLSQHSNNLEEYIEVSKSEIENVRLKIREGMNIEKVLEEGIKEINEPK